MLFIQIKAFNLESEACLKTTNCQTSKKSATQLFTLKAPRHLVQLILKKEHICGPVPPNYSYCRQYNVL